MYQDFLPLVAKPARYIDGEVNVVRKNLSEVRTRVCLFFPDTYEVGMSHLGFRILYDILNSRTDTACERVFSPWTDYEDRLRASGRLLSSLESNLALNRFDIIGVTLQYELSYTNILAGLALGGIPVRSRDRGDDHPVVVAGGPCAVNPEPLAEFFDVFFIGEAEEAICELVELRQRHSGRSAFLQALAEREGFYVPAFGRRDVRRRRIADLNAAPYPRSPLVPLMKPIHDRISVEVARGCIRGCRFCQAGVIYRPYRERSQERVKELLAESLRCTGYDELSLASLSTGDYSGVQPLIIELMRRYRDSRVSISLPSLRVGTLTPEMIEAIAGTRKTGFTLAPEAGTERLRRVINKPVSDLDLLDAAETIFKNGWSTLKLYFMLGLPTETGEDLDGIIRIARDLLALGKRTTRRHVQLNVSVSTFVPKPHTPFQWFGQASPDEVRRKQAHLERGLRIRGIAFKPHDAHTSVLEAAFARGDASLSSVIERAVELGCRFDGWSETFDPAKWREAFRSQGLDAAEIAGRTFGLDERLPWGYVATGVSSEFLKREYERALAAETTENCRVRCEGCGMGCSDGGSDELGKPRRAEAADGIPASAAGPQPAATVRPSQVELTARVRMKYAKTGPIRFLSHLDFMTMFHRAAVRAEVPLAFSQGFNPHPKVAFGPPLAVGMESEAEYLDLETDPLADLLRITKNLNRSLPAGVRILESRVVPKKAPSLSGSISRHDYEVIVPFAHAEGIEERIRTFLAQTTIIVVKDGVEKDLRPGIASLTMGRKTEHLTVEASLRDSETVRPRMLDVVRLLFNLSPDEALLWRIKRIAAYAKEGDRWISPMDAAAAGSR